MYVSWFPLFFLVFLRQIYYLLFRLLFFIVLQFLLSLFFCIKSLWIRSKGFSFIFKMRIFTWLRSTHIRIFFYNWLNIFRYFFSIFLRENQVANIQTKVSTNKHNLNLFYFILHVLNKYLFAAILSYIKSQNDIGNNCIMNLVL